MAKPESAKAVSGEASLATKGDFPVSSVPSTVLVEGRIGEHMTAEEMLSFGHLLSPSRVRPEVPIVATARPASYRDLVLDPALCSQKEGYQKANKGAGRTSKSGLSGFFNLSKIAKVRE